MNPAYTLVRELAAPLDFAEWKERVERLIRERTPLDGRDDPASSADVIVVIREGTVRGLCSYRLEADRQLNVDPCVVIDMTQRDALAEALIGHIAEIGSRLGCRSVRLRLDRQMAWATPLLARQGFHPGTDGLWQKISHR